MSKKTREETLDLYNNSKKKKASAKKQNKNKEESTKDEKINLNNEIIIGLKVKEEPNNNNLKKKNNNKNKKKTNKKNGNNYKKNGKVEKEKIQSKKEISKNKSKEDLNYNQPVKNQVTKKLTPKQELIIKKRKAILKVIKWTSLVVIIIGLGIYAMLSPIFNIKTINVVGNSKLSTDEVISLSKIELETNMFKIRKSDIVSKIKENPYVESVQVKRNIPDTIELTILERQASFKFKLANAYVLINNQGYILEISGKIIDLPIIEGFETAQEEIQAGNRLCNTDLKKLGDVLKIMESVESNDLARLITKIDITNDDDYVLTMAKMKKTIHLGDASNLSTKMSWIITFNQLEGDTQGEIMLNVDLDKNKPYFREKT